MREGEIYDMKVWTERVRSRVRETEKERHRGRERQSHKSRHTLAPFSRSRETMFA
jgi:hypothetical protein